MVSTVGFAGRCSVLVVGLGALVLTAGCGSSDRLKKQVGQLENQITAMRADQDRLEERLSAMELSTPVPSKAVAPLADDRVERPRLKVIHLGPEAGDPLAEPADAPAPATEPAGRRPIIRGSGDRVIKVGDGESGAESTSLRASEPKNVALARNSSGD